MTDNQHGEDRNTLPVIKVVFFDVDGTLLPIGGNKVPKSTRRAVQALKARGIRTVIATARHMNALEDMPVKTIRFDSYITLNGQVVCDEGHNMTAGTPIDRGEMEILARIFAAKKIPFVMVHEKGEYINYIDAAVMETQAMFNDALPAVGEYGGEDVYQIMAFVSEDRKQLLRDLLDECAITSWSETGIDIIPKQGGKVSGIQTYLDMNGIDRSEAMAFGDGENDIEMLKYVGIGVAMGNGGDAVKAAADYVTDTVENGGIEKALKHFGLID